MPIYEYKCLKCGHQFELIRLFSTEAEEVICPHCGDAHPQKLISAFSCTGNKESTSPSASGSASDCSARAGRFT